MKIIINAITAKNVGGGYQGALNFIKRTVEDNRIEWYYIVSEKLDKDLKTLFKDKVGINYFVFPVQPDFRHTYLRVKKQIREIENDVHPDLIYTLLSPSYFSFKTIEVQRFANAWITNTNEYCWKNLSLKESIKMKINQFIQRMILRSSKYYITQTEVVKQGIMKMSNIPSKNVKVISNILPDVYRRMDNRHEESSDGLIHIACIGGAMPHKDFRIIPDVVQILTQQYKIRNIKIHMTLPTDSDIWLEIHSQLIEQGNESVVQTHGNISQEELATIYRKCSISLMPSLLETFSVSSLESMYFGLTCVASDFPFYRDVMGDASLYYKPQSAGDASKQLALVINDPKIRVSLNDKAEKQLHFFSDYEEFYNQTLSFLQEVFVEFTK